MLACVIPTRCVAWLRELTGTLCAVAAVVGLLAAEADIAPFVAALAVAALVVVLATASPMIALLDPYGRRANAPGRASVVLPASSDPRTAGHPKPRAPGAHAVAPA